jgi:hypothetical protein
MQRGISSKQPQAAVAGVIETIADGLSLTLVRPGLMLVPVALDAYLWLGWRVSLSPLTDALARRAATIDSTRSADVIERLNDIGRGDATWLLALQTPSLLSDASRSDIYDWRSRPEIAPDQPWIAAVALAVLVVGAMLLPMIYGVPLADNALGRERGLGETARAMLIAGWRFFTLVLLMIVIALGGMIPFIAGAGVLALGGTGGESTIVLGASLVIAALFLLLWFAPDAILVSEVGPIRAARYSLQVVRTSFWQTIGLVGASMLITLGLSEIWLRMADNAPGLVIGVLLNAFVSTGLTLASMLFYVSRIRLLQPERSADPSSSARR